jgi:hypothetical protein
LHISPPQQDFALAVVAKGAQQAAPPPLQQLAPALQQSALAMELWLQQLAPSLQQEAPFLQQDAASLPWQQLAPLLQQDAPSLQQEAAWLEVAGVVGAAVCAHMLMANSNVTTSVLIFIEFLDSLGLSHETVIVLF